MLFMLFMKTIDFNQEALDETIAYLSKDIDRQEWANETLAKILEIVREKVSTHNTIKQTDYAMVRQIIKMFPE